jgi:D-alanyl-D-alanine carboxypeptidase/D-alanyl-D-alanine-endopeptidase (penicillin-binding protein 4)
MLLLVCIPAGFAQAETPRNATIPRIDSWVKAHEQQNRRAEIGVCVVDLATGRTLYEHKATQAFKPASNQKLLTTAFALARLGKDFKFTTAVVQLGDDLVLTGDCDPTLGDPRLAAQQKRSIYHDLDRWAARVRNLAGPTVAGDLLLRTQVQPDAYHNPDWSAWDRTTQYGAPVADLNFHNNCYDVTFTRHATGRIVPVVAPASAFIDVREQLRMGKRQNWQLQTEPNESAVLVKGEVKSASRDAISAPCSNPPMLLGRVFRDRLKRAGVTVAGQVRTVADDEIDLSGATILAGTQTPLATAITRANKRSLNSAAECLLLRAGDGTWAGSRKRMAATLRKEFGFGETLVVRDGSGLSHRNRTCPGDVVKLLTTMAGRDDFAVFLASLPVSGTDGTLRKRLRNEIVRGRIAAKTGYISGASSLSGYVLGSDGEPKLAFSILANGHLRGASSLANRIAAALVRMQDSMPAP